MVFLAELRIVFSILKIFIVTFKIDKNSVNRCLYTWIKVVKENVVVIDPTSKSLSGCHDYYTHALKLLTVQCVRRDKFIFRYSLVALES